MLPRITSWNAVSVKNSWFVRIDAGSRWQWLSKACCGLIVGAAKCCRSRLAFLQRHLHARMAECNHGVSVLRPIPHRHRQDGRFKIRALTLTLFLSSPHQDGVRASALTWIRPLTNPQAPPVSEKSDSNLLETLFITPITPWLVIIPSSISTLWKLPLSIVIKFFENFMLLEITFDGV